MVLENPVPSGSPSERLDVWTCPASDLIYRAAVFSAGSERKASGAKCGGKSPGLGSPGFSTY